MAASTIHLLTRCRHSQPINLHLVGCLQVVWAWPSTKLFHQLMCKLNFKEGFSLLITLLKLQALDHLSQFKIQDKSSNFCHRTLHGLKLNLSSWVLMVSRARWWFRLIRGSRHSKCSSNFTSHRFRMTLAPSRSKGIGTSPWVVSIAPLMKLLWFKISLLLWRRRMTI